MALSADQRGVVRGAIPAWVLTLLTFAAGFLMPPLALPAADTPGDRLAFALHWDLVLALWLMAAVGAVANGRFGSPRDIAGSGFGTPSPGIAIRRAILQNTQEQVVIALILHLALATLLPFQALGLIPLLVLQFSLGRLAFWVGYPRGAPGRAFGFGATFYPAIPGALLAIGLLAWR